MAFKSARPIRQWRPVRPECYEKFLDRLCQAQRETRRTKDFITTLMLHRKHKAADVETAVELALENGVCSSDGVRHLLIYANGV